MDVKETLSPSVDLLVFSMFVVHCTTVFFISATYGFAYRFLESRFYIPLAFGWLANAAYIALETILMLSLGDNRRLSFGLATAGLGILSMPFFHYSVLRRPNRPVQPWYKPLLIATLLITICLAGAGYANNGIAYSEQWFFAILTLPAAAYSAWTLLSVAHRFSRTFPEADYEIGSRLLYGSWAAYGILQFFYPFKFFFGSEHLLFYVLFTTAFLVKALNLVALLNVLRQSYGAAQAEVRAASVLADIGNVAAGLHHDIANPLTWIDSELSLLAQKRNSDETVMSAIKKIRKPMQLIDSAIKFVSFIRIDPEAIARNFRRVEAKEPLSLAVSLYRKKYPKSKMRIVSPHDAPTCYIRANPDLLAEAFLNLMNNALEASAQLLRIRIRRVQTVDPQVEYSFMNDGDPLTADERNNCFKPGWSTKEKGGVRANIGMGLYMASKIISIHRGGIDLDNDVSGRVVVVVTMPAAKHVEKREVKGVDDE